MSMEFLMAEEAAINAEVAAIEWCKNVDGENAYPKLPVHIRVHNEAFVELARTGQAKVDEPNSAIRPFISNLTLAAIPASPREYAMTALKFILVHLIAMLMVMLEYM